MLGDANINIFFIFPSVKVDRTTNHGIAYLCGVARDKGHNVKLYQPKRCSIRELYSEFRKNDYDLCLVSSVTNQWPYALKLIKALRKISDIMIVVGGHHVTNCLTALEENEEINGICIGEGDIALGELLDRLEKKESYYHIKSMHFRKQDEIIKNELNDLVDDLDSLPFPDYSVFKDKVIKYRPALMLSRGCPYNCAYCCNNSLRKLYKGKGKYVRLKSVNRAIEEVTDFVRKYNPSHLDFDDDTFVKNKRWLCSFLDEYKKLIALPLNCNTRPETIDEELCKRLKDAKCDTVCVGIESGNEELRKKVLQRNMSNESIKNAFMLLHKYGIKTYSFNMVGFPDETYENYLDTVKLNKEIRPKVMQMTIFYPFKGTDLWHLATEKGYLPERTIYSHNFYSRSLLKMEQFTRWKIKYAHMFFQFNVLKDESIIKAFYYMLRYNLLPIIWLKSFLKILLRK